MSGSNPVMLVRISLTCGCVTGDEIRYQDPRPEIGSDAKCGRHGKVEVDRWWARSR
jgi:hypothetical protein